MADAKRENESIAQRMVDAYWRGWDDGENAMRARAADLLERSGKERAELEERVEQLTKVLERIERHSSEGLDLFEHDCRFYLQNVLELAMKTLSDLKKGEEA